MARDKICGVLKLYLGGLSCPQVCGLIYARVNSLAIIWSVILFRRLQASYRVVSGLCLSLFLGFLSELIQDVGMCGSLLWIKLE